MPKTKRDNGRKKSQKRGMAQTKGQQEVEAQSINQQKYLDSIFHNDITISIGPAGTGKSYLACYMATKALKKGVVDKIILTRPIVDVGGERMGFLPGDVDEKFDPYLRPFYDCFDEFIGGGKFKQLIREGIIQAVPLAHMRGTTMKRAFVLLDEAQNTNPVQMKMFLTRFGKDSRYVINGDITQTDLRSNETSGLSDAIDRIINIEGIGFIKFTLEDVVRHDLVRQILERYSDEEAGDKTV